jgi:hypothetical protein
MDETLSLLSQLYLQVKTWSSDQLYPFEREMYRLSEPSQRLSKRQPAYLPVLLDLLKEQLSGNQRFYEILHLIVPLNQPLAPMSYTMKSVIIYGPINYVIYVDVEHDTHEYILQRLQYYTGIPVESIQLLSEGSVIERIDEGTLSSYCLPSCLSYIILPFPPTVDAEPEFLPPRLDLAYDGEEEREFPLFRTRGIGTD